jgi:hypothetical protein
MPLSLGPNDTNAFFADGPPDPAYPVVTPPDPVYPGQTRAPLAHPLDELATPALWSRLALPLERALVELWDTLGLAPGARPTRWVAIHYGRMALNAHVWERVRARLAGDEPDPGLVEPAHGVGARIAERLELVRARLRRRTLQRRLDAAEHARTPFLRKLAEIDPGDLDAGELARGPLDERAWGDVLIASFGRKLRDPSEDEADPGLRAALALEQRCTAELGQRLAARGALSAPELAVHLTIPERIRAVHEGASHWTEIAAARLERVEQFAKLELPRAFFGRPRPDTEKV